MRGERAGSLALRRLARSQGTISEELQLVQLAAFLLAQGNHSYFALSEGWTDVQQPPLSRARPLEQWGWQPAFDVRYGRPLGAAVVTNLRLGDQLYVRHFTRCVVSLCINAALGNSSNASIQMK